MSKHMKKIISVLIAASMALSTLTIGFAADDTTDTTSTDTAVTATEAPAEATEAPADATEAPAEATEAPAEATEAPAEATEAPATSSSFDDDTYYQEAVNLLLSLGVIVGDDGGVRPDSEITRAEMATIVLRICNMQAGVYNGLFTDVSADHWAAGIIQTAYDAGIISGHGDGTFAPEDSVTFEQVAKMLVCAINYQQYAEANGGYPNGYLAVANTQDITKNAVGTTGQPALRGLVIKMVYNTLVNADYGRPNIIIGGVASYDYNSGYTLLSENFDIEKERGVVFSTARRTLYDDYTINNQVRVLFDDAEDGAFEVIDSEIENMDEYVGIYADIFYLEESNGDKTIVAVNPVANKNSTLEVNGSDVSAFANLTLDDNGLLVNGAEFTYYPDSTSSRTRREDVSGARLVYNGQAITSGNVNQLPEGTTLEEFVTPDAGTVTLLDYDNDGNYDVILVEKYITMLVTTASDTRVTGRVAGETETLDVDTTVSDKTITVTRLGDEVNLRNLRKDDVATIMMNFDESVIEINVTGETITGTITRMATRDGDQYITVNGTEYEVDKNVDSDDIRLNSEATFSLDAFDKIANIEYTTTVGGLQGNEKYGWIVNTYINEDAGESDVTVRIYDVETAQMVNYKVASRLNYWGPDDTENSTIEGEDIENEVTPLASSLSYDKVYASESDRTADKNGKYVAMCKYETNSDGELTKLFVAQSSNDTLNEDADGTPLIFQSILAARIGVGNIMDGQYRIVDGITEFYVPDDMTAEYAMDVASYSVGTVVATSYLPRESGGTDVLVVDVDESTKTPGVCVRFNSDPNQSDQAIITDDGFSSNSHATMIVSGVSTGSDGDGNSILYIEGRSSGSEVTYQTTDTSALYELAGASVFNQRRYNVTNIWDASQNDSTSELSGMINEGDILMIDAQGSNIKVAVKMGDVLDIMQNKALDWTPATWHSYNTGSREGWFWGEIAAVEIDEYVMVTVGGTTWSLDPSKPLDVYEMTVDENGKPVQGELKTEALTPDQLVAYTSDTESYDVLVLKTHRGAIGDAYIYRFTR